MFGNSLGNAKSHQEREFDPTNAQQNYWQQHTLTIRPCCFYTH
jgi:hypothetical protein